MKKNVIWNTEISTIRHDVKNNILIKNLKMKSISDEWFDTYKKLQDKTPHVVKIIDKIDNHTYTMEYVNGIKTDLYTVLQSNQLNIHFTKLDYIRLLKCLNHTWMSAIELSSEFADNRFFVHQDFHLRNIAVIKNENKEYHFRFLDADAWYVRNGFYGIDTFYTTQLKLALSIQRVLT